MRLSEVVQVLEGHEVLAFDDSRQVDVTTCFAADLMSEVLAFAGHGALLITGLTNIQSVHTAEVADLHGIVFVNGKRPEPSVLARASERRVPLLTTRLTMYEACGRLYGRGLRASVKV